jgi:hypothetical protein
MGETKMRVLPKIAAGLAAALLYAAPALGSTIGYTEGARPLVAGTTAIADNADDALPGYNLGTLSLSGVTTINLYGRVETAHDIYQFQASAPFAVMFIFGGYDLAAGGHVSTSGFLADPSVPSDPGNTSEFKLRITAPGDALVGDAIFTTPTTSGNSFIFSATAPGTYRFRVDGGIDEGLGGPAFYDLRIAATPLPAALPVFASGLGLGLAMLHSRRKRKPRAA